MLRFHTQTAGVQLTAQQPEVNLIRVAVQALAAVMGGTQSLHTNSFDEAIALPTEKAARLALRTQQVIAYESDLCKTIDPFAGSFAVESLTDEVEAAAVALMDQVADLGGAVAAIEQGFQKSEIERSAYRIANQIDDGERVVVGVNKFTLAEEEHYEPLRCRPHHRGTAVGTSRRAAGRSRHCRGDLGARPAASGSGGHGQLPAAHEAGVGRARHGWRGGQRTARGVGHLPADRRDVTQPSRLPATHGRPGTPGHRPERVRPSPGPVPPTGRAGSQRRT